MDIKQLEVFVAVAKHKSFSKAAREVFLTQPTISSHIQNLEKEMNTVLLKRSNKTIELTDSGQILYNHAIVILNDCKKALYDIREYSGKIEGSIHIVCSSIPEAYIFPRFLDFFCEKFPNIKFTIDHSDSNLVIPEILSERASFGIVGSKLKHPHVDFKDLLDDELILICPNDTKVKDDNGFIEVEDFMNMTYIMRKEGSGTRNVIVNTLSEAGLNSQNMNVRALVASNDAIIEMVKSGLGSSLVSEISVLDRIRRGEIKGYRVKGLEFRRKFYFIFSKKKIFTPTEKKFLEYFSKFYDIKIGQENK